ncbi:MAG: RagB/SusD family nutrient uptake outer membrane protein [Bacteroidales bacterium]|nr:RagB/SusD family nutrient uptake outer membrane protein [Bacteroidales bacterium]
MIIKIQLNKFIRGFIFYSSFSILSLFYSCNSDFLELKPSHLQIEKDALNSVESLQTALNGCYSLLGSEYYYGRNLFLIADLYADNALLSINNTGRYSTVNNQTVLPTDEIVTELWYICYELIHNTNNILAAVDSIKASEKEINQIKGEAKVLRALAYFDLIKVFAHPYKTEASSGVSGANGNGGHAGVPLVLSTSKTDTLYKRESTETILNFVINELRASESLLTHEYIEPNRFSKNSTRALLYKVYHYTGNYTNLYNEMRFFIREKLYTLVAHENYLDSWQQEYTNESVFSIAVTKSDYNGTNSLGYLFLKSGYNEVVPSTDLAELFGEDSDIRKQLFVTGSEIKKYPGRKGVVGLDNIPVLRYSDLILMNAEMYCKLTIDKRIADNYYDSARYYLDLIRFRANPKAIPSFETGEKLLSKIQTERRKELLFEGDRFYNLKLNMFSFSKSDCHSGNCEFNFPDKRAALPIPQNELNVNKLIEQNFEY